MKFKGFSKPYTPSPTPCLKWHKFWRQYRLGVVIYGKVSSKITKPDGDEKDADSCGEKSGDNEVCKEKRTGRRKKTQYPGRTIYAVRNIHSESCVKVALVDFRV